MKRIFFLILAVTLALFVLTACYGAEQHQYTSDCDTLCDCCPFPIERETTTEHTRDNCEDTVCSTCGTENIEPLKHEYESGCSRKCKICGAANPELKHTYKADCGTVCTVCGDIRTAGAHTYDDGCDKTCNLCFEERAASALTHAWTHPCSTACTNCGATREVDHQYEKECSVACKFCGATRQVKAEDHDFEFGCSLTCDRCGFERVGTFHVYDSDCDQICDYGCGHDRGEQHVWDGPCNALECDKCGASKAISHVDEDGDFLCDMCDAICDHDCFNDESLDCDRECVVCGEPVSGHTYDYACDTECSSAGCTTGAREAACSPKAACGVVCQYCGEDLVIEGEPVAHTYAGDCDTECDECGFVRDAAGDHVASATKGCGICDVCDAATGFEHSYEYACSNNCDICEAKNPNAGHVGDYSCSTGCKYCGEALDSINHEFATDCATSCVHCHAHVRTDAADPHTDVDGDKICDECGEDVPVDLDGALPEHTIPKND